MKRNILILAIIALIFSGCRKEADYHPYIGENGMLAYNSYSTQFDYLWKCISTGYVFWDIDQTDWDAIYDEYIPKFVALDEQHTASNKIRTSELQALYKGAMGGLKDHHLLIQVKNLDPPADEETSIVTVFPGMSEIETRDYYVESREFSMIRLAGFIQMIGQVYDIESPEMAAFSGATGQTIYYFSCLINLPGGRKIPYLWQSAANLTDVLRYLGTSGPEGAAAALVDRWFTTIKTMPRNQLAGIILDNRCNSGGHSFDLNYLVGSYINTPTEVLETRYKEGPGRLEHSAWVPLVINPLDTYHRDLTAENIPFVVLCDMYSISMGEIEPMVFKKVLPTSYVIGERTFGATGPLFGNNIDVTYGGTFGDINTTFHYVYTSTFETRVNGNSLEGTGLVPDMVVNRKDHDGDYKPQLDAAIKYIQSQL